MKQQPTLHSDPLSRKEKAISHGYWTIAKRKRNNYNGNDQHEETPTTSNTSQCIQVNSTPDKHGIGTFATTTIQAGQILVSRERPIVAHVDCRNYRICNVCFTPIGSLYDFIQHITGGHDEFLDLFDLEKLVFVKNEDIDICKCGLEYCSNKCREDHQVVHRYSCQNENIHWKKLKEYIDDSDYSILLRLATQCVLKTMTYKYGNTDQDNASLYWWKEYHHPKWWDIQGTKEIQEKKDTCKTLSNLLKQFLLAHELNQDCDYINNLENHVAEILGMLQCNVMEIRYPSPFAQLKSHLEHFIEDMKEYQRSEQEWCSTEKNVDSTDVQMKAIEKWIEKYSDEPEEIVGSGLFPILTLANHDCDPNASIEFLNESGLGSMVALRDIPKGEEVAITYIPNGDYDCGDVEGKRFQHFQPTRTWKFLNARNEHDEEDCPGDVDDDDEVDVDVDDDDDDDHDSSEVVPATESDDINNDEQDEDIFDEDDQVTIEAAEGSTVEERQKAILSYDFQCACNRCRKESSTTSKSSPP